MRRLAVLPLALCALTVHAQEAQRPEVTAAAKAEQARVVAWRRDFHQNPELSNREQRTAAKVAEHLRALGLKPQTGNASRLKLCLRNHAFAFDMAAIRTQSPRRCVRCASAVLSVQP